MNRALLAVIAVASLIHILRGEFAGPLLIYAAGVLFVMVHGALSPRELWSHPTGHPA
jgi:hypothetical protein